MSSSMTMTTDSRTNKQAVELRDVSNYLGNGQQLSDDVGSLEGSDAPAHAVEAKERWNQSWSNIYRTASAFFGFMVLGAGDAGYGPNLPYLQRHYNISYTVVSLIFLSPVVGYVVAASINNYLHKTIGQRGIAIIGPSAHIIGYIIIALHPPFPALVVVFILAGFGNGILDAAWNAWIGNLANPNEVLGFLHGFYGAGAVISPIIATALITRAGLPWWNFYWFMVGAAAIELAVSTSAFWKQTGAKFRATMDSEGVRGATRVALKTRVLWVSAAFLLFYVGLEVGLSGWVVTFMLEVRNGKDFESGLTSSWFWVGITAGRVVLGFITPKLGENLAISFYLVFAMGMQLLFWLVPSFVVSSIAVAFVGFFLGPLFPAVVVAMTKLLPAYLHVPAVGFAAAFGGGGAAVLPFAIGAIAQRAGVKALQPVILGLLAVDALLWFVGMPKITQDDDIKKGKIGVVKAKVKNLFVGCFAARL